MSAPSELLELGLTETGKDTLRLMLAKLDDEWCNVLDGDTDLSKDWWNGQPIGIPKENWDVPKEIAFRVLPDYPRDLNACHKLAKRLEQEDGMKSVRNRSRNYSCHLTTLCSPGVSYDDWTWGTAICAADADATQRTIALILALQSP